jgi:hypothetical protein
MAVWKVKIIYRSRNGESEGSKEFSTKSQALRYYNRMTAIPETVITAELLVNEKQFLTKQGYVFDDPIPF